MICGEAVGLRLVLEDDLAQVARWYQDQATRWMFYSLAEQSEDALKKWLTRLLGDPARMQFMIQRLQDKATIGLLGLEHIDYRNQAAELAGLVVDPRERGKGWGTRAVQVLIRYSFDDLNLHRLYARLYSSNCAARCVAEKAGLQSEGVAREAVLRNGVFEDLIYMSILREEWKHGRTPSQAL